MTKYILQSGGLVNQPERARAYYKEAFSSFDPNKEVKMFWCFFASEDYGQADLFSLWFNRLGEFLPEDYNVVHSVATVENFAKEIAKNDIIYLHGGYTQKFLDRVIGHDLLKLFEGKVVCTNSASSIALSVAAWDSEQREVVDGLGILPCKTLVHFGREAYGVDHADGPVDWEEAKEAVMIYRDQSLPVYALEEGEFVVLEI